MKNNLYLLLVTLFISSIISLSAQVTNTVTFQIDMSGMLEDGFNPVTDSIMVEGLVWDDGEVTVTGDRTLLPSEGDATLYVTTLEINSGPNLTVGDSLRWKLFTWPSDMITTGGWEGGFGDYDGRPYFFQEDGAEVVLDPEVPNYQYIVTGLGPQNTLHIMADVTDLAGTGEGFFDPSVDYLTLEGFNWDGNGFLVSGERRLTQNPLLPGIILETTVVVELDTSAVLGDSLRWKFRAQPGERWANSGYEVVQGTGGDGHFAVIVEDGATVDVGPFVPGISPVIESLDQDVTVLFQVDLNNGATNRFDSSAIPLEQVELITVRGSHSILGSWSGNWTPDDTTAPGVPYLNDDGLNGDKVAGDNIWSGNVVFPQGESGGGFSYKYGCYYPGCEELSLADYPIISYYMDVWGGTGSDILGFVPQTDQVVEFFDVWPNLNDVTSVKVDDKMPKEFLLSQNYPNPFNPATVIRYSVPQLSAVKLNVYNILGEKIINLVNEEQSAGTYEVKFDASKLASGIYFYTLSSSNTFMTKKMILLK